MLLVEPIGFDRWRLVCDRCGNEHPHPLSAAAARELDGQACFVCEIDPAELELAMATARYETDRN